MTKEEILEELIEIRSSLYQNVQNMDRISCLFDVNNLDTLIYKIHLDLKDE